MTVVMSILRVAVFFYVLIGNGIMAKDNPIFPLADDFFSLDVPQQRVLIVDDDESVRDDAMLALAPVCEVVCATRGAEAIELATVNRPDLILLGTVMSDMSGFDVIRQLKTRKQTEHIPVIFVTKTGNEDEEVASFALGAFDYISLPRNASILTARVGIHLRADMQRKTLERLSRFDSLTGVLNRRLFDDLLTQYWTDQQDGDRSLSLLLIDVDNFKNINDTLGHQAGDEVLRLVARTIWQQLDRPGEIVARYGGEEFACLLPDSDLQRARDIAEVIRLAINQLKVGDCEAGTMRALSVSIGVACTRADTLQSCYELIASADRRLYAAKRQGRNQIVS